MTHPAGKGTILGSMEDFPMIRYSTKLIIHIAALAALVGAACWLAKDKSWEPALALLAALSGYSGSLAMVLRDHFEFGTCHQISLIAADTGFDANASFVSSSLRSLTGEPMLSTDIERVLAGSFGLLFRRLKIIDINENGQLRPVSERAGLFLRILSDSASKNIPLCGDWKAEGTQNDSARHLGEIIEKMEEFRISASGGVLSTSTLREVSSSLVMLKAMKASEPVFLMRWSDAWGGYFWFIGGVQESSDSTAEACAQRELNEELGLVAPAIQHLAKIISVTDRRISVRQHVLSDYEYNLFSVAIDEASPSGAALLRSEFSFPITVKGGYQVSQKCKWFTWDEIRKSPNLLKDAGEIVRAIDGFGIARIPLSLRSPII
jgi:8-oxo-dGTP pyrophosphatase MutT (NUDIX family)